ncbi:MULTISPECIES: 3-oxoadipyl-CoA thiolase [Pseudomonas]|uniref:acetyl-CoA C-acyltransferase n=1 Tax=Pseudomonas petroselini TaxID=2899822 RepID=A0ABS8QPR5_9PSED|nr:MULTISPECIES: 3-oxoadipyl-CoA thiolase [Pseudomonas]MCD7037661.1 3-oxoadipyl-CoA thiolase [Pseudomonas petroselini]MCD7046924.1 3-oxoadipyl-CoA thiolase [Pseudomonas petroselini]MCD7066530.1 3-oxoadipyl-CoA thiolase [Pseudomonas petroselini]MCD7080112.1 3-oxoadipyl-CoA thiolase [Pseudomonas petroselini]MCM2380423.1 3-oxoadipyl-CoA thiolase [Pseudomonas marginalis]
MNAYIYDGLRSPFGRHAGVLANVRLDDLLASVVRALVARNPFAAQDYEDLIVGCTNQAGEDARNLGRHAALLAGLSPAVGGLTVNRLCGSGLAAVLDAARAVHVGQGELFIAGGAESMSRAPFVIAKAQSAYSRDFSAFDSTIGARFPNPRLEAEFGADTMPQTADNVARELGISRDQADTYAARSQALFEAAVQDGFHAGEILPIEVPQGPKQPPKLVDRDEPPRPDSNFGSLSRLRPLFEGGVVTAGNASGVNDGAAAMLIGSQAIGEQYGLKPRAQILTAAIAGVEPRLMGLGPVPAIIKALQRANLQLADMDLIEINEAFAAQVLGCAKQLGLAFDDPRLNPNGGAIAIGHPLGASGARLAYSAVRQLERSNGRYALVSLCIGLGQGIACVIERLE